MQSECNVKQANLFQCEFRRLSLNHLVGKAVVPESASGDRVWVRRGVLSGQRNANGFGPKKETAPYDTRYGAADSEWAGLKGMDAGAI
jgi:hypothetical protein